MNAMSKVKGAEHEPQGHCPLTLTLSLRHLQRFSEVARVCHAGSTQLPLRGHQALARLVPVSSTPCGAYTSGLSTRSSTWGLTWLTQWVALSWGGLRA